MSSEISGPYSVQYQPQRRVEIFGEGLPRIFVHQDGSWTESGAPVDPDLAQALESYAPFDPALEPQPVPYEPPPSGPPV